MQDLAEEVEEDRRDFLDKFDNFNDTPAGQFLNNMGFALGAVAAVHPAGGVARIGVTVAAGLPKVVEAITALGAVEIAREFSILCNKKAGGDSKARVVREQGSGEFWDKLITGKTDPSLLPLRKKSGSKMEVRFDGKYYYQFDKMHKTQKVHLHRYERVGKKVRPIEEVDPETGNVIAKIVKPIEETWF